MATRTPHAGAALEVLTAANLAKYPKGLIAYDTATADAAAITTSTPTDLDPSVTVTLGANRLIVVTGYYPRVSSSVADDVASFGIDQDGSQIAESRIDLGTVLGASNGGTFGFVSSVPLALAAGSYTFTLTGAREVGTGNIIFRSTATLKALIRVDDVGPSF